MDSSEPHEVNRTGKRPATVGQALFPRDPAEEAFCPHPLLLRASDFRRLHAPAGRTSPRNRIRQVDQNNETVRMPSSSQPERRPSPTSLPLNGDITFYTKPVRGAPILKGVVKTSAMAQTVRMEAVVLPTA